MPSSDEFGLDDDDAAFLALATQVENTQRNERFATSPRPTKKRRVRRKGPSQLDGASEVEVEWSEADEEAHRPPKSSTSRPPIAPAPPGPTQATQHGYDDDDHEMDDYYFPGELGMVEEAPKKSRFKIHVPEHGGKFPDMVFTQTQHGLDKNPAAFRGAVWKRPPAQSPPAFRQSASGNVTKQAVGPSKSIHGYFQALPGRKTREEEDAALAARLQAEENARVGQGRGGPATNMFDATQDLADLPDDAFSSSSPEKPPKKNNVIEISSPPTESQPVKPQPLRGPQMGLKQMTIFGQPATQGLTASQAANKRHAWPLVSKNEPPTHHKLDDKAMSTWVYPTNLGSIRDYQYNIVSRSLFRNTLVALPTGLGKTFIAATVMLNYYRWTTHAQMVFMAPTKPLIAQQMEACYGIVGIPKRDTVLMTGETAPGLRAEEWLTKRVFFMTPQTVINDLKTGICDPKKLVLLVVDEAHKATGGYAYTEVAHFVRRFNSSFRVLALTATPGSTTESVQAVIDNLGIAHVELRTEQSLDIRQYTHEKLTETEIFDFSDEQELIMGMFAKALRPVLDKLCSQNAYYSRDPMALTAYGLTTARQKWNNSDTGRKAPQPIKAMMNVLFTVLSKLAHNIGLLKHHGIGPFYSGVLNFQREVQSGQSKGKIAAGVVNDENFNKMISTIRTWTLKPDFIGHPKLEYLREIVLNHFLNAGEGRQGSDVPPSATRVMVFASYRDSTEDICRVLKRNEPMIRPTVFVGQAASKGQEGMNQKKQNEVIQDFKTGKFNTLIATSIGEEGLDIGTVDMIVCYDASSSPIRMLQRIGRTGRKRVGRVHLLLMRGKEEKDYAKAQDNYAHIQKTIADGSKYAYRDDQSPRILPRDVKPVADKRPVEIPVENSEPVDLNEKSRKGRGKANVKRPPKKFHMPDGVRTGFAKASTLGSDGEGVSGDGGTAIKKKTAASKQKPAPERPVFRTLSTLSSNPEIAPVPHLGDVLLSKEQQQELKQNYARTADGKAVRAPNHERYPNKLRELGSTKFIAHGRAAREVEKSMKAVHEMDVDKCHRLDTVYDPSDAQEAGSARMRLVSPEVRPVERPVAKSSTTTSSKMSATIARRPSAARPQIIDSSDESEDEAHPRPPPGKKPRGRPKKAPVSEPVASESEPELPAPAPKSVLKPAPKSTPKPRGRPRSKLPLQRAVSYGSAAGEGASSSPEPTPADMRIGTQGIDLGSRDTSGEDEEEEPDSEDQAFLANTSEPIETFSSSLPGTLREKKGGRLRNKIQRQPSQFSDTVEIAGSEDEDEETLGLESDGDDEDDVMEVVPVAKGRKRRIVDESDDE